MRNPVLRRGKSSKFTDTTGLVSAVQVSLALLNYNPCKCIITQRHSFVNSQHNKFKKLLLSPDIFQQCINEDALFVFLEAVVKVVGLKALEYLHLVADLISKISFKMK